MHRSLTLYFLAEVLRAVWVTLFLGILYFHTLNLSLFSITAYLFIVTAVAFVTDIPLSLWADKKGPKFSLILSAALLSASFFALGVSYFIPVSVGVVSSALLLGLSHSFRSGAVQSYAYIFLKQKSQEGRYLGFMSKVHMSASCMTACSVVGGSFLYTIHPSLPFFFQSAVTACAVVCLFGIEPVFGESSLHTETFLSRFRYAVFLFSRIPKLLTIIFLGFCFLVVFEIFNELTNQSYWSEMGLAVSQFGFIGCAILFCDAAVVAGAPYIRRVMGRGVWIFLGTSLMLCGGLFYWAEGFWGVALVSGLLSGLASLTGRIADANVQELVPSDSVRSTFSSFAGSSTFLATRIVFFVVPIALTALTYRELLVVLTCFFGFLTVGVALRGALFRRV